MKKGYTKDKTSSILIRMSQSDKEKIEANASRHGFNNLSEFVRIVSMNASVEIYVPSKIRL